MDLPDIGVPLGRLIRLDFSNVKSPNRPETIVKGERNNMLVLRLNQRDALRAPSLSDLMKIAEEWNARLPEPMRRSEVLEVTKKKWKWFQTKDGVLHRAAVLRDQARSIEGTWTPATQIGADFEQWTVFGVLPEVGRVVLYGPPGSMKTLLAIDIAAHLVLGTVWHGCDIDYPERVAYVATENPESVKRRFRAWARDHRVPTEKIERAAFVRSGALDLNEATSVGAFVRTIPALVSMAGGVAPRVWFLDTLATAMSGDENTKDIHDAVQVLYNTIRVAIEAEPLVVLVHHTGKDENREERGHSSLRAVVDTAIKVEVGEATGSEPSKAQPSVLIKQGIATVRKQRDGIDGKQFAFEVHAVLVGTDRKGRPRSQAVVRHIDDAVAVRAAIGAKRGNRGSVGNAIRVAFDELADESGEAKFPDLLSAVAKELGKDPAALRPNFNRALATAGFRSSQAAPGKPSVVRRA